MKRLYTDDKLALTVALLLIILAIGAVRLHDRRPAGQTYNPPVSTVPATAAYTGAIAGYPAPNKQQAQFSHVYQTGDIGFDVAPTTSMVNNGSLTSADYAVTYHNYSAVHAVTVSDTRYAVGCIAKGNHDYHQDSSIFSGSTADDFPVAIQPYRQTIVTLHTDGSCQYIGTRDGLYWWDVTKQY